MYASILCLQQHEPRLVVLAALICLMAASASLSAYRRAARTTGAYRLSWAAAVAALLGGGVWATHFVAMLAYQQQLAVGFELEGTALSLLAAVAGMGGGVLIAASRPTPARRALGGAAWGAATAVMHFMGVAAMRLPATVEWNPALAAAAVAIGVTFGAAALATAGESTRRWRTVAAPLLLTLAICGLHFTAMAAVTLHPAPMRAGPLVYSREGLALAVGALVMLILMAAVGMQAVDRFSRRTTLAALERALDQAPTALGFYDPDRGLTFWNRAYADVLAGYGIVARNGLTPDDIAAASGDRRRAEEIVALARNIATADDAVHFQPLQIPSGRWFDHHMAASGDGGWISVLNDITVHRELVARETEARAEAERASGAKSEFLANMSHEIRTPLNAVLGMAQVLSRSGLSTAQREQLQVIDEAGRSLLAILNDVLDLTKIEAAKLELEAHPFDLEELVASTTAAYAPLAGQKDLAFAVEVAPEAAGWWIGDSVRVRQVLSNLIANAVKFTAAGRVDVRVGRDPDGLAFSVTDTGIGIAADKLDGVFGKFTQADASTTRRFGGTGLGLAICEQLVQLMGGRIQVTSVEGAGSCFSFTARLEHAQAAPGAPATDAPEAAERPLRILAAEDNPTNQLILAALLEPLGAELTLVGDGGEAVEAVARADFDLVLMDVQMPVMGGIEATAQIRRWEAEARAPRTPILALTANVMSHQLEEYAAAGMDGWVGKPIEAPKLFAAIAHAVSAAAEDQAMVAA